MLTTLSIVKDLYIPLSTKYGFLSSTGGTIRFPWLSFPSWDFLVENSPVKIALRFLPSGQDRRFTGRVTWHSDLWQQMPRFHQGVRSTCSCFTSDAKSTTNYRRGLKSTGSGRLQDTSIFLPKPSLSSSLDSCIFYSLLSSCDTKGLDMNNDIQITTANNHIPSLKSFLHVLILLFQKGTGSFEVSR